MNTRAGLLAFREIGRLGHALHQVTAEFVHLALLAFRAPRRRRESMNCADVLDYDRILAQAFALPG
jgi:hypothetical protein